jgi:hypothetical protein
MLEKWKKIGTQCVHVMYALRTYFFHFVPKTFNKFKNNLFATYSNIQLEPAFSVGKLPILHVKSTFGKYRRGVIGDACAYLYS